MIFEIYQLFRLVAALLALTPIKRCHDGRRFSTTAALTLRLYPNLNALCSGILLEHENTSSDRDFLSRRVTSEFSRTILGNDSEKDASGYVELTHRGCTEPRLLAGEDRAELKRSERHRST